jgi:hypothetical protein
MTLNRNIEILSTECFSGHFLTDSTRTSLIRSFGSDMKVGLSRDIKVICRGCFFESQNLHSLPFESGSKLTPIEARALYHCSFESIHISRYIAELELD